VAGWALAGRCGIWGGQRANPGFRSAGEKLGSDGACRAQTQLPTGGVASVDGAPVAAADGERAPPRGVGARDRATRLAVGGASRHVLSSAGLLQQKNPSTGLDY